MNEEELSKWRYIACFLEISLNYPEHLHDLHNDYPLAPETLKMDKVHKLIPNLYDKEKYVIHHETLKFYLKHGLEITEIHRGIAFEESDWTKPCILRAQAANNFEKEFFKLMNNSVFEKTIENVKNYVNDELVTNEKQARKLICKPNFVHRNIFCDNLSAIHMGKTKVVLNNPIYVGMAVLDLSKTLMYKFHYEYIKAIYGDRAKLLFTETDSLMYEIKTDDFYKDISPDVHDKFDTSTFSPDRPSGIPTGINNKIIGMFKDEAAGQQIIRFVGLRAKLYAFKTDQGFEVKKCKGIKKGVIKNDITFND